YPLSSRQETEIMLDLDWRVTDADEQTFQLEQTIRRIRLSLTTPTEDGSGRIDLDTQRKESLRGTAGALLQQLNALVGLVVEVKMGSDGSIVGVTLPESSQEQLRKAPSATVLREMFSVDGIERLFAQSSLKLPAESVLPGFTWSIESDLEGWPGKRLSKQLVLKGREPAPQQNVARIDVKSGLIDAEPRSEAAAPNNNSHESRVQHFQGTGWALIDTARGHVLETESTLELTTVGTLRDAQIETRLNKSSRMQFTRGGN
ncbi:MAG TPA: hypothetical protein PKD54_14740, partial [Pirellulaceae bacterium]|nr:hypothetical protein [Pirellulaceae bacterium]